MGLNRQKTARDAFAQEVHYLSASISFADNGKTVLVGTIPAGALLLKPLCGIQVNTAFDGTTTVNLGTAATPNLYGSALATSAVTFVPIAANVSEQVAVDTPILAAVSGTAPTTGTAAVVIAYLPRIG